MLAPHPHAHASSKRVKSKAFRVGQDVVVRGAGSAEWVGRIAELRPAKRSGDCRAIITWYYRATDFDTATMDRFTTDKGVDVLDNELFASNHADDNSTECLLRRVRVLPSGGGYEASK